MSGGNTLRMPFAQWLGHMCEDGVSPMARWLAVSLAAFRTHTNAELELLSGVEGKTYNKYKKELRDDGYVVLTREEREKGGRGIGFEPLPAYKKTPVTFTDLIPRKGGKYYPGIEEVVTEVNNTMVTQETLAVSTPVPEKSPHTPINENNNKNNQLASQESVATPALAGLNGSAEPMISDIVRWMVGGEERDARNWLAKMIHLNGGEVIRESYQKLCTDLVSGQPIAQPLQAWGKIATRMRQSRGGASQPDSPESKQDQRKKMLSEVAQKIEAENKRRGFQS